MLRYCISCFFFSDSTVSQRTCLAAPDKGKLFENSKRNVKKDVTQINPIIKDAIGLLQKAALQYVSTGLLRRKRNLRKVPGSMRADVF